MQNNSAADVYKLYASFVLRHKNKIREIYTTECVTKKRPLLSNGDEIKDINVKLGKRIFTKRELGNYYIDVYLYKDAKYKTLIGTYKVPSK